MESQQDMLDFTNASCREVLVSCLVLLGGASKQCKEKISVIQFARMESLASMMKTPPKMGKYHHFKHCHIRKRA